MILDLSASMINEPVSESVRPPAVAGAFYPGSAPALGSMVDGFLAAARSTPPVRRLRALIAPHAGYVYSGPVAATGFALLTALTGAVKRVVVLGPSHFVSVHGLALSSQSAMATPLGELRVWVEGWRRARRLPQVVVDDSAHAREHSLEVELPFLQRTLGQVEILPLAVGSASPDEVAEVLELVWNDEATLLVVSSDLSHYLPYEEAARRDRATCEKIVGLGGALQGDEACGCRAINGLLEVARRRGLRAELLDLRNSGDTAGDRQRVVGYAALAFS